MMWDVRCVRTWLSWKWPWKPFLKLELIQQCLIILWFDFARHIKNKSQTDKSKWGFQSKNIFLSLLPYWYQLLHLLPLIKSFSNCYKINIYRIRNLEKSPKNDVEVFCENHFFEICAKSIISYFQFPPLLL